MATDQYDLIRLLDAQGVTRMSVPTGRPPVSSVVLQRIPEILRSGQVTFQDFHRNEHDQRVYLDILVPIFDEQDASRPLGVFYLRIDPDKYLYPFIKHWPVPSETAEILLIRREGNEAVFLNELRFQTNTALNLRSSLENTNMPAVKAALGQKGIVEGVDYRGVPVLAALRAVPDSPWFLVARMDTAEVYAPLRERLWLTILLVSLLLISAGAGIGVIWRHQRVQFYKERYKMAEALREGEARYRAVVDSANDPIVTINTAGEIAGWNGAAQKIFHYTAAEMLGQPLVRILPRAGHNHFFTDLQRIQAGGSPLTLDKAVELPGQREDGSVFPMEISVAEWRVSGERFFTGTMRDITARKRAEVARRENEERLRSHTDNSPMAVVEWSADLIITRWTGAAEKMFGWSAEEAIGKPITELPGICEEDLPIVQSVIQQLADGVSKQVFSSNRNRTRNGQVIHCEWYNSVLHDAGGKMTSVLSQILDITARKLAEENLSESEIRYRALVEHAPVAVFVNRAERVVLANAACLRLFGATAPEQLLGKSPFELFHPDFHPVMRERIHQLRDEGKAVPLIEEKIIRLDGTPVDVEVTAAPFQDQGVNAIHVILRDITERKRAEEALRESQALYHSLVEQLPVGVFRKDPAGRYVLVNPWFCRLKGMKAEEFLGKTPQEVAASEVAKQDSTGLAVEYASAGGGHHEQIMQTGKPIELVEEYTNADGRKQFVHAMKLPVFDLGGKVIGTQGLLFDITEIKQASEALRRQAMVLNQAHDTITITDLEGIITDVNAAQCQSIGRTREELIGKSVEIYGDDPTRGATQREIIETTRARGEWRGEVVNVTAVGKEVIVECHTWLLRDDQGKATGLCGVATDITERKRAEVARRENEERLRSHTDNSPPA